MAKANLVFPNGTTVSIEGTVEEVDSLLSRFSSPTDSGGVTRKRSRQNASTRSSAKATGESRRLGPQRLTADLVDEGWFKSKRTIGDVQKKLEEKGHIYAMESLSTPLLRLTRKRVLRRIKDEGDWAYVS